MKKMREINYICYLLITYILSSLYGILFRLEVPRILKIENLNNLSILFLVLLITGYLITNFFKSLKEVFKSGAKKLSYVLVFIWGVNTNNIALIYAMSICLIGAYTVLFLENRQIKKKEKNDESENEPELYPSRKNLMEVLSHALGEYSLIALDGTWGSGKTTFMNIAMRENREKYYYIPINVMLFENRNSLKTEFLNQLKGIFKEEGIFQGSLMDFDYYLDGVSNDWVKVVKNIIFSKSKSFKEANEKLKSEIGKIEKRIVVGVDNLERIYGESEPEWKQILGFIHELQELGIMVVVMANLEEMLTTKKETGEKYLPNYEYFDKFYEFKLKLNEVTTEEIIDKVEIKGNIVDREWLKEEIKELTKTLEIGREVLNDDTEEKKDIRILYNELHDRYLKHIVNPRKIEKIVKNIENKQKTIKNIYKFIDDDEHDKLIFKASMFSLIYFDYMNKIKNEEFEDFVKEKKFRIDNFFGDYFKNIGLSHRGLNRLLHYDSKENLVKDEIEKLISTKEINLFTIEKRIKDLNIYSSTLDPDSDQKTTKEAYKIIEKKLIELEKSDRDKIHEIIKENESFICKMNYLCYSNELGIYKEINYKFSIRSLNNSYMEILMRLDLNEKIINLREVKGVITTIGRYYGFENDIDGLILNLNNWESFDLMKKLREKTRQLYFSERAEKIKLKIIINFLNILKIQLNKEHMENKKSDAIITLEQWKNMNETDKIKVLQKLENNYCHNYYDKKSDDFIKIRVVLEKIIKDEKNEEFILKLESLIESLKIYELPSQIGEVASKIKMEKDSDIKEKEVEKLVDFINDRTKGKRYQYIYNSDDWTLWINKVKDIGIEVDLENKTVKKKNNDKA